MTVRMDMVIEQQHQGASLHRYQELTTAGKEQLTKSLVDLYHTEFTKAYHIKLYQKQGNYCLVINNQVYHYLNRFFCSMMPLAIFNEQFLPQSQQEDYYLSYAKLGADEVFAWTKEPMTTTDEQLPVDWRQVKFPPRLVGYSYDLLFSWRPELINLLGKYQATFIDRFKRPLDFRAYEDSLFYPGDLAKQPYNFKKITSQKPALFPIAVNLASRHEGLACLDLEPHFTSADLALANSFDAYYVEETPHGGRHYLVKVTNPDAYKYRLTEHLEVQVNTGITFYGLAGRFLKYEVQACDLSKYQEIKHRKHVVDEITKLVQAASDDPAIGNCLAKCSDRFGGRKQHEEMIGQYYENSTDRSYSDFLALTKVWYHEVRHCAHDLDQRQAPIALGLFGYEVLPYRFKFDELRTDLSYLSYIGQSIVGGDKQRQLKYYQKAEENEE